MPKVVARNNEAEPITPRVINIEDQDQIEDFENLIAELPADSKPVKLYRVNDRGRPAFLCSVLPGEFNEESVLRKYGGGTFRLDWVDSINNRRLQRPFTLEGEPIIQRFVGTNNEGNTPVINSAFQNHQTVSGEISALREEIKAMKNGSEQSRLLELLITRNSSNGETDEKFLMKMKMMKELFGPSHQQMDTSTIFTAMKSGMDLVADGLGGRGSDSTSKWLSIVDKYAPVLLGLVQKIAMPAPAQYNTSATVVGSERGTDMDMNLKPQLAQNNFSLIAPQLRNVAPMFIAAASRNAHPGDVISAIYPLIPQDQHQTLLNWLASPNWFADLCSIDNRIEAQMAWWNESFHPVMIHAIQNSGEILEDEESEIDNREM